MSPYVVGFTSISSQCSSRMSYGGKSSYYSFSSSSSLSSSSSSSSGATTSNFECFGHLNKWFPLITILDSANPILYFQILHVISYVIFPSVLWSPLWSYWHRFPLIYFFLPLSLPAFDVNGQTSLIVVLLCDLLYSYVLLINLIHRLFWFSMYQLFLL